MRKVVINRCYGGFGLSAEALTCLVDMKSNLITEDIGGSYLHDSCKNETRSHPDLISVIEQLGQDANGCFAKLAIVSIPDDVEYTIEEYDGIEWVAEKHRTWE